MTRAIELVDCPDPRQVVRAAVAADRELAALTEALAPRTVETPDGQVTVAPTTAELDGARVHVIPLPQEMRAGGTITPPAAVVIVDGPAADEVAAKLDVALLSNSTIKATHAERPDGTRVVLDGPMLANTGATPRVRKADRLALVEAATRVVDLPPKDKDKSGEAAIERL